MIKKISVILLTVLVILGLGFSGCDNGNTVTTTYTVTFNSDDGTPAVSTAEADEGGTVTLPEPPTKEGFTFGGWYTAKDGGGTAFTGSTAVTGDITVYAKWDGQAFSPGTPAVAGNTIVHENPAITAYGGDAAVVNPADGSVTLNGGGGFSYAFPDELSIDWKDCATIKIEYTVAVTGGQAKLIVKDGVASYDDPKSAKYPLLETGEGKFLTYDIGDFEKSINGDNTPGISFQFNSDGNTDGNFTVTVTKVTFTYVDNAGEDYTVDLTGKTVKNAEAWTAAYGGFVIPLDLPGTFPYGSYTKLTVEGTCYDPSDTALAADWGQGQIKVLKDAAGTWEGGNEILTQYNIGMQTSGISITLDSVPGGLLVQNSTADVAYIEITLIKFHN
jgi:uncharacterized repeat protein (TIGR02543 family)